MKLVMIGAGYVGLVSAACFAECGHDVRCIDKDQNKISALRKGVIPIFEPGLKELVEKNVKAGRLSFADRISDNVEIADAVFIAVGTPSRRGDGFADLSFVYAAAREIAQSLSGFTVVVTKSTVPVGTGDAVERIIREVNPVADFEVVSNPEFLREGSAIGDFRKPDRIVIGSEDERARNVMSEIYRRLDSGDTIMHTGRRTSELIKYAANAFLATKITFINEIANLCEEVRADVEQVAKGIGLDERIGPKFLVAGPGYGGSCLPKDTSALIKIAQDCGTQMRIVETVVAVNDQRKRAMARKVVQACGGSILEKTISVLGLAFKKDTDDVRDSPALSIIPALKDAGARIRAFDPEGMEKCGELLSDVTLCSDMYDCMIGAHAAVIVTEWDVFRLIDFERAKTLMAAPVLVDLRNLYQAADVQKHGFTYADVGRVGRTDSGEYEIGQAA